MLSLANPESRPTFPSVLRREREKAGKSLHDVATHVGVKRDIADAWELGTVTPNRFEFKRLVHMMRALRFYPPEYTTTDQAPDSEPTVEPAPLPADAPEPQTWAEALRAERCAEGMSQRELGELCGVGASAVTYWEQNRGISLEMADKCSSLFPRLKSFRAPIQGNRTRPPHTGPLTASLGQLAGFIPATPKAEAPPVPPPPRGFVHPPGPAQKLVPFRARPADDLGDAGDETTIPPFVRSVASAPKPIARVRVLDDIANDLRAEMAKRVDLDKRIEELRTEMRAHMEKFQALL